MRQEYFSESQGPSEKLLIRKRILLLKPALEASEFLQAVSAIRV